MSAFELSDRVAVFLRELTGGRAGVDVHTIIVESMSVPGHDPRMDAAIADAGEFAAMWDALIAGRMPGPIMRETGWQSVVLPAVVTFSSEHSLKLQLELAARLWLAADQASRPLPEQATMPLERPAIGTARVRRPKSAAAPIRVFEHDQPEGDRPGLRPVLVAIAIAVMLVVLIVALAWRLTGAAATLPTPVDRPGAPAQPVVAASGARPSIAGFG